VSHPWLQAGVRDAVWEAALRAKDNTEGVPDNTEGGAPILRGEAWICAAEGELLRFIAKREERVATLAHEVCIIYKFICVCVCMYIHIYMGNYSVSSLNAKSGWPRSRTRLV